MQMCIGECKQKGEVNYSYPLNQWEFSLGARPFKIPLVVLHTKSMLSFHLSCMVGWSVWICMKGTLFGFLGGQTHLSTPWHAKTNLTLSELIQNVLRSKIQTCTQLLRGDLLYAKQQTLRPTVVFRKSITTSITRPCDNQFEGENLNQEGEIRFPWLQNCKPHLNLIM